MLACLVLSPSVSRNQESKGEVSWSACRRSGQDREVTTGWELLCPVCSALSDVPGGQTRGRKGQQHQGEAETGTNGKTVLLQWQCDGKYMQNIWSRPPDVKKADSKCCCTEATAPDMNHMTHQQESSPHNVKIKPPQTCWGQQELWLAYSMLALHHWVETGSGRIPYCRCTRTVYVSSKRNIFCSTCLLN